MDIRYRCPHCGAHLNPVNEIILRTRWRDRAGLLLLHPQPGNYSVVFAHDAQPQVGTSVDIDCPVCGVSLTSSRDSKMAELVFEAAGTRGLVVFSRTYGTHATYVISAGTVQSFGEDSDQALVNFWGAGPGA